MKTKTNITFLLAFLSGIFLYSCSQNEDATPVRKMIDSQVPDDFNYETLKTIPSDLSFTYSDSELPMALERFGLYADAEGEDLLFTGVTDLNGKFSQELVFPNDVENVFIKMESEEASNGRTSGLVSLIVNTFLKHKFVHQVKKVEIESIEIDEETGKCKWRIRNPFKKLLKIKYLLPNLGENGSCDAPQGDSFFYTSYSTLDCGSCESQSQTNALTANFDLNGENVVIEKFCKCFCEENFKYYNWPSKKRKATFAFEDLWPSAGDYDMNDVVVETKFKLKYKIVDFRAKVEELIIFYQLKYSGAGLHNGLAIQLPVKPEDVESVTGTKLNSNVQLNYELNGVESDQSLATIILFEDTRDLVNQMEYHNPSDLQEVRVKFKEGIKLWDLVCKFPFNPFIFNSSERVVSDVNVPLRTLEVHLPRKSPTDLADLSLFDLGQEDGNPKYLSNPGRYPWALLIPNSFEYPRERVNVKDAYPKFESWVANGGKKYKTWYYYQLDDKVIKD